MITECTEARDVRSALELAARAPSLHNSQPWKWRYDDSTVDLYADFRRWLLATDTATRDLVLSCGAALHHLRVALAAAGIAARVHRRAEPGPLDHLATLHLQKAPAAQADLRMAAMINRRRTDRRRYGDWPVPDVFLEELEASAAREGALLRVLDRAGDRAAVLDVLRDAAHEQESVARYAIETALWSARRAGADGIPPANLLVDAEHTGDGLARTFEPGSIDQKPGPDGAVLLVLGTASDDPLSRLRAGEALSAVLLHATDVGLATCPLTQPLEVSSTYRAVRDDLLGGQMAPQVLIRVGWGPPNRCRRRRGVRWSRWPNRSSRSSHSKGAGIKEARGAGASSGRFTTASQTGQALRRVRGVCEAHAGSAKRSARARRPQPGLSATRIRSSGAWWRSRDAETLTVLPQGWSPR